MKHATTFLVAFGSAVRSARLEAGLTQAELATRCGKFPAYISNVENGHRNVTLSTLLELAIALCCEPGDLVPAVADAAEEQQSR